MAAPNRTALIVKAHKVLKQHYEVIKPDEERPLLQHMLFACCLENATYATAEKVYGRLTHNFFDWNEVRVSTVSELAGVMKDLPDATTAANNLKKILQGVFESTYSFDLEQLKKQNIGQGIKRLQSLDGVTPFILAYAVQAALEGHSIPLDRGALELLGIVGIASPDEVASESVAGLERAIPKNKGIEFGSLLHQLAADYIAAPSSPNVKKIVTAINPRAVIPKRVAKSEPTANGAVAKPIKGKAAVKGEPASGKTTEPPQVEKGAEKPAEKAPAKQAKPEKPAKPTTGEKLPAHAAASAKRKSAGKQLAKKKPR
jgi:endonuclease III